MGFINERKNILRAEDGPLVSVDKDGNVVTDFSQGGGGGGLSPIPSTAKAYLPDFGTIFDDIIYIAENEPVGATDSIWENWTAPLVLNLNDLSPGTSELLFNKGIYEENDYNDGFSDIRNIGYSGVVKLWSF
jgi:hypothetical protein